MRLWLDADHCPAEVREIVSRAAVKKGIDTFFIANRKIPLPASSYLVSVAVEGGPQAADRYLIDHVSAGDLAITADIPLASELVSCGVTVIHPRGDVFTEENIRQRLSLRNFLEALRSQGVNTRDPSPYRRKAGRSFADAFDRELHRAIRRAMR